MSKLYVACPDFMTLSFGTDLKFSADAYKISGVLQHNVGHKALTRLSPLILHHGSCWPCMAYDMHTQNHSTFIATYSKDRKILEGK